VTAPGDAAQLWIRFLSGPDIDGLGLTHAEIIGAVEDAVRAHGQGRAVVEPRMHLIPDNAGAGHFNVLRGHLPGLGVAGIKVVGDFVANYARGLPSELGLLTLYDPATGVPRSVMDATLITACRTGAMTAVGARYLARPDSRVLGHVGARGTALWNVVLLDEMFTLDEIRVTSRRPESREAFARQLAGDCPSWTSPWARSSCAAPRRQAPARCSAITEHDAASTDMTRRHGLDRLAAQA